MNWIDITGRTESKKIIVAGPSHCAWAYFFLYHMAFLKTLRQQNPDAIIVTGGYLSDWWYSKDVCDYYVGHPIDSNVTTMLGRVTGNKDPYSRDLVALTKKHLGRVDEVISMDSDNVSVAALYRGYLDTADRPKLQHNSESNRIAIWGRHKPNCGRTINNGSIEHWDRTVDYLINKGYDVSIMGTKDGSYTSDRSDVTVLQDIDEMSRAQVTFEHLQECLCSLSDISASAHFCQHVGHPLCIFNLSDREQGLMTDRNHFGTLTTFSVPWKWKDWRGPNPLREHTYDDYSELWESDIEKIINLAKTELPHKKDVACVKYLEKYLH